MSGGCCAIIPAPGRSRGLALDSLIELAGRPLVSFAIEAALAAARVDRVLVSTDDEDVAQAARRFGAEVVRWPSDLATAADGPQPESVLMHALEHLAQRGVDPERLLLLHCRSPLTTPEDIDGTLRALREAQAQSAVAVTSLQHVVWKRDGDGGAPAVVPWPRGEPRFVETGALYAMTVPGFRAHRRCRFGETALYVVPGRRVLAIESQSDLETAEHRLRQLRRLAARAKLPRPLAALVMDFDGVFTDNLVYTDDNGRESVACSRADGMGLEQLRKHGVPLFVLSKEQNPVVQRRCDKLEIACLHGIEDKRSALVRLCEERQLALPQVIFVGNDINDLECLEIAGCGVAVADAHPSALAAADLVLNSSGGRGALRELSELILENESSEPRR